ncbi:MAG TPA: chorismate mutase, partial [Steroidobacteraceae bacterium]
MKRQKPKSKSVRKAAAKARPAAGGSGEQPAPPSATPAGAGLGNIRDSIDAIDARIHSLLNERARFAQLVGISKSASGKAVDYYRPEREAEVLRMALKRNQGPLRDEEIARLFRE